MRFINDLIDEEATLTRGMVLHLQKNLVEPQKCYSRVTNVLLGKRGRSRALIMEALKGQTRVTIDRLVLFGNVRTACHTHRSHRSWMWTKTFIVDGCAVVDSVPGTRCNDKLCEARESLGKYM